VDQMELFEGSLMPINMSLTFFGLSHVVFVQYRPIVTNSNDLKGYDSYTFLCAVGSEPCWLVLHQCIEEAGEQIHTRTDIHLSK